MRAWIRRVPPFLVSLVFPFLLLTAGACGSSASDGNPAGGADVASTPDSDDPAVGADVAGTNEDSSAVDDVAVAEDVPAVDVPLVNALTFTPDQGESEAGAIWATTEAPDEDTLVVHLWAGGFPDVLGWAFDFRYHPGVLTLEDVALHDVLTASTFQGQCGGRERGVGRVNIGCARFLVGQDHFGLAKYSAPLEEEAEFATLRFRVEGPGSFELAFDSGRRIAKSGDDPALDIAWRGGLLEVVRAPAVDAESEGGSR